jgi:hypothetical protein
MTRSIVRNAFILTILTYGISYKFLAVKMGTCGRSRDSCSSHFICFETFKLSFLFIILFYRRCYDSYTNMTLFKYRKRLQVITDIFNQYNDSQCDWWERALFRRES